MRPLPKMVPGALPNDVIDLWMQAEVRELVVVQVITKDNQKVVFFFEKDGTLVGIHDPRREEDYHK